MNINFRKSIFVFISLCSLLFSGTVFSEDKCIKTEKTLIEQKVSGVSECKGIVKEQRWHDERHDINRSIYYPVASFVVGRKNYVLITVRDICENRLISHYNSDEINTETQEIGGEVGWWKYNIRSDAQDADDAGASFYGTDVYYEYQDPKVADARRKTAEKDLESTVMKKCEMKRDEWLLKLEN